VKFEIISRGEWGAKHGRGHPTPAPQSGVVFHNDPMRHTTESVTKAQGMEIMRIIEAHAAKTLTPTNPRISYQWAVDGAGRIYEGLGFNRIGAHVANANTPNLGIFLMRDGRRFGATDKQWWACSLIVREGVRNGALTTRPELRGHRDLVATECPGDTLYKEVRNKDFDSLLQLTSPLPADSRIGTRVWSSWFGEHLVVAEYFDDKNWKFVRESELRRIGVRAQTPLSQMPPARD
jgi:hypothetical protein